jgi:cell division protein FtsB
MEVVVKRGKRVRFFSLIAILVLLVYTAVHLVLVQSQINQQQQIHSELEEKVAQGAILSASLSQKIVTEPDEATLIRWIRERLGFVMDGETVLVDISK